MAAKPPRSVGGAGSDWHTPRSNAIRLLANVAHHLSPRTCGRGNRKPACGGQVHARVMPLSAMRSKSSDAGSGLPMQPPQ